MRSYKMEINKRFILDYYVTVTLKGKAYFEKERYNSGKIKYYKEINLCRVVFTLTKPVVTPKNVPNGIAIECNIYSSNKKLYTGVSVCNPKDKFNTVKGLEKSLERALKTGSFNKEQRKIFWTGLFQKLGKEYK